KVALHSFVENLFRSIWGTPHAKAPHARRQIFLRLPGLAGGRHEDHGPGRAAHLENQQAWLGKGRERGHYFLFGSLLWYSLPLRFWVNISKSPQFVFHMVKTPNLDGCLSGIAQAFMDSFSLSETQLGKHAPANKLLYARDIPKFKQEVKAYYRQVRDQQPVTAPEFQDFLLQESKATSAGPQSSRSSREACQTVTPPPGLHPGPMSPRYPRSSLDATISDDVWLQVARFRRGPEDAGVLGEFHTDSTFTSVTLGSGIPRLSVYL
ncbi:unnamed protein product, partial [Tetraodon nigroviridis]